MKEKPVEFPSYSTEYLDDIIEGDDPDLDSLIFDICVQQTLDSKSEPEVQNHLPLSSAGDNIGNPDDPRRTRSNFQRAGVALSCPNYFLSKYCYLMIISDPNSY